VIRHDLPRVPYRKETDQGNERQDVELVGDEI